MAARVTGSGLTNRPNAKSPQAGAGSADTMARAPHEDFRER